MSKMKVKLLDGTVISSDDDGFPPLCEIKEIKHACDICPVLPLCQSNDEFRCNYQGMFGGFYVDLDGALERAGAIVPEPKEGDNE